MKAHILESNNNHLGLGRGHEGKVHKSKHKEEENEEIKAYLTKLQELVPFMPKNRKLSKFEVIQHVIQYIRDLRETLGLPANSARIPMDFESIVTIPSTTTTTSTTNSPINSQQTPPTTPTATSPTTTTTSVQVNVISQNSSNSRQPLGVSLLNSLNGSCASQEIPQMLDKPADVAC